MIKLSPSILAIDFANAKEEIKAADLAGADYIHIDVMDGLFVPSISFGMPVIESYRKITNKPFDVHLMINEPKRYIKEFVMAGADIITVHIEACKDILETINIIKSYNVKCGIAINPETPVTEIIGILDKIDMILIMTVHPGFGGQKYISDCTQKIQEIKKISREKNIKLEIEVDGGIKIDNVDVVLKAGANVIVSGSGVFNGNIEKNIVKFKEIFKLYY